VLLYFLHPLGKGYIHKFDGLYYGNEVITHFWFTIVEASLIPWQAIKKNLRFQNLTMVYDKHVIKEWCHKDIFTSWDNGLSWGFVHLLYFMNFNQ